MSCALLFYTFSLEASFFSSETSLFKSDSMKYGAFNSLLYSY